MATHIDTDQKAVIRALVDAAIADQLGAPRSVAASAGPQDDEDPDYTTIARFMGWTSGVTRVEAAAEDVEYGEYVKHFGLEHRVHRATPSSRFGG